MFEIFNMGVGLMLAVNPENVDRNKELLDELVYEIGRIVNERKRKCHHQMKNSEPGSGNGSNFQVIAKEFPVELVFQTIRYVLSVHVSYSVLALNSRSLRTRRTTKQPLLSFQRTPDRLGLFGGLYENRRSTCWRLMKVELSTFIQPTSPEFPGSSWNWGCLNAGATGEWRPFTAGLRWRCERLLNKYAYHD